MSDFVEKLRNQRRKERLAREMTHTPQQPIYNPVGDALVQWGRGVKERVTHPLETLAGEATRWRTMPIEQKAEEITGMLNPVAGLAGIFAGKGAKTANLAMLAKAEELAKAGVPDEQIWKQTGWTFGFPDKKPRFEIPDIGATAKFTHLPEQGATRISERAIEHPELFGAYPETQNITQLGLREGVESGSMGNIYEGGGFLTAKAPTEQGLKGVGLHELQHAIQQREGFAGGGNLDDVKGLVLPKQQRMLEELKAIGEPLDSNGMPLAFKPQSQLTPEEKAIKDRYTYLVQQTQLNSNDPYQTYRSLAGEAEARLTQARMNLTPEQRLAQYPISQFDVPVEQQIVRYGDGNAMSIPQENQNMAKLIKDMEDARAAYELQRAQRLQQMNQPSNALRNLSVGAGALGGGTAAGYYGMGMVE